MVLDGELLSHQSLIGKKKRGGNHGERTEVIFALYHNLLNRGAERAGNATASKNI